MNPLQCLQEDRVRARELQDPCADLCALATVDPGGGPQVRTLVLRDLQDRNRKDRLALFVNATSPKWPAMQRIAILVYLASLGIQYRLACTTEPVPAEMVRERWQLRPEMSKRLDWFYEQRAQSTPVESRERLLTELAARKVPDPLVAPDSARGVYLLPWELERLDLNRSGGVHDRRHWRLIDGRWQERVLLP